MSRHHLPSNASHGFGFAGSHRSRRYESAEPLPITPYEENIANEARIAALNALRRKSLDDCSFIELVGVDEFERKTGTTVRIRRSFWAHAFDGEAPDVPMVLVEEKVITQLQKRVEA